MYLRTFLGKHVSWSALFEVIGSTATGPPPEEVPHGDAQDGETGDSTNNTTNDCADRSRICSHSGHNTLRHCGRGCAACGDISRITSTCSGSDEDVVENESSDLVGRRHRDLNFVRAVCQFRCLEVDYCSIGVYKWLLGTDYDAVLSK
jgi:hypothetical protein